MLANSFLLFYVAFDEQNERLAVVLDLDLERSETFEDVTDEAIEIHDQLLHVGMIVNNNERNEDYEVIERNLQQGELQNFEDKSYEASSCMTESMTDSLADSYASTVVTTASLDSERPLEISMNTVLEEAGAWVNANEELVNFESPKLTSKQKHSEKDLHDYDIVESTSDPRYIGKKDEDIADRKSSDLLVEEAKSANEETVTEYIDAVDLVTDDDRSLAKDNKDPSIPGDMVDITDESEYFSGADKKPSSLEYHDVETVGSDIVDIKMPVLNSEVDASDANSKEIVGLDIVDIKMPVLSSDADASDANSKETIGLDIVDIKMPFESAYVDTSSDLANDDANYNVGRSEPLAGEDISVDGIGSESVALNKDTGSLIDAVLPVGEARLEEGANRADDMIDGETRGVLTMPSCADSTSEESSTKPDSSKTESPEVESLVLIDTECNLATSQIDEGNIASAVSALPAERLIGDNKEDDEAFYNIEPDDAFFDARSEISEASEIHSPEIKDGSLENFVDVGHEIVNEENTAEDLSGQDIINVAGNSDVESSVCYGGEDLLDEYERDIASGNVHTDGEVAEITSENAAQISLVNEVAQPEDELEELSKTEGAAGENQGGATAVECETSCAGSNDSAQLEKPESFPDDDLVHIEEVESNSEGISEVTGEVSTKDLVKQAVVSHSEELKETAVAGGSDKEAESTANRNLEKQDSEPFEDLNISDIEVAVNVEPTVEEHDDVIAINVQDTDVQREMAVSNPAQDSVKEALSSQDTHIVDTGGDDEKQTADRDDEKRGTLLLNLETNAGIALERSPLVSDADTPDQRNSGIYPQDVSTDQDQEDETITAIAADGLTQVYEKRQKLGASSPGSVHRQPHPATSPQPVPKERKKNKKKKKPKKEKVKVLDHEPATTFEVNDDSTFDDSTLEEAVPTGVGTNDAAALDVQGPYPEEKAEPSDSPQVPSPASGSIKGEETVDTDFLEVRRHSVSSTSDASDSEAAGKSKKKGSKKSKKDSKKDGCKNQ